MDESVCLNCGGEMEQDWAPCPKCGWKAPETWEEYTEEPEEGTPASRHAVLARPRPWIQWTLWGLLVPGFLWLIFRIFK